MSFNIITSLNKKYWELGSNINIKSWDENFPKDVIIHIFSEDNIPDKSFFSNRIKWYDLYQECPELLDFKEKYKNNPKFNGTFDVSETKKYKWNAIKFAHKTFPIFNLRKKLKSGSLIWLDTDVLAIEKIDYSFLNQVCPKDMMISYLGRPNVYSECGWVYYNLNNLNTDAFLNQFEHEYVSGNLEHYRETHDSYIFDVIRLKFDQSLFYDLNFGSKTDKHPFHQSLLRKKLVHNKGSNKSKKQQKFLKRYNLHNLLVKHD